MTALWKKGTKQAYYGYVASLLVGLLGGAIVSLMSLASAASTLTGNVEGMLGAAAVSIVIGLIGIAATVFYLIGVNSMKKAAANTALATGTSRLFLGAILSICGSILAIIPMIGIVGSLVALVAFIITWTGYSQIKNNAADANAQLGGAKLSSSALLSVISAIVAFIPMIGWVASLVLDIIALVFAIQGWKALANSELE